MCRKRHKGRRKFCKSDLDYILIPINCKTAGAGLHSPAEGLRVTPHGVGRCPKDRGDGAFAEPPLIGRKPENNTV